MSGLDEAILGSMNSCGDPEQDGKKIADLLKYGAHSLVRTFPLLPHNPAELSLWQSIQCHL